jgi:hypothetical protein
LVKISQTNRLENCANKIILAEEDFSGKEYLVHVAKKCREAETKLFRDYKEYLLLPVAKVS